ncbi:MAG: Crp/Fnr family transcriptional regulator [Clostridia bacterium]|nr:Crp/Fnr family transcriptional regulator [Clostridia bacterium]
MDRTLEILQKTFLFRGIENVLDGAELPTPVSFKKGETIYSEKEFRRALGILLAGKAKATPAGNSATVLNIFLPGAVFGAAAVFSPEEEYVSCISAASDCRVLFFDENELSRLFSAYPQAAVNYISFLSQRIRFLNGKLSLFTKNDAEGRVYEFLAKNCNDSGTVTYTGSMALLARNLGVGRTSLYRALDALEHKKMIVREDGKIKVLL